MICPGIAARPRCRFSSTPAAPGVSLARRGRSAADGWTIFRGGRIADECRSQTAGRHGAKAAIAKGPRPPAERRRAGVRPHRRSERVRLQLPAQAYLHCLCRDLCHCARGAAELREWAAGQGRRFGQTCQQRSPCRATSAASPLASGRTVDGQRGAPVLLASSCVVTPAETDPGVKRLASVSCCHHRLAALKPRT